TPWLFSSPTPSRTISGGPCAAIGGCATVGDGGVGTSSLDERGTLAGSDRACAVGARQRGRAPCGGSCRAATCTPNASGTGVIAEETEGEGADAGGGAKARR